MSFVNIRKLKEIAQKKINGLTNQSDLGEFEDLVRFVQLSGGGHLSVDSDGTLPDTGMIAFDKQYDRFFYNKKAPKFRADASRPGGTVSDNAVTRTFDRRRRRRTSWSRKIYGRIAQGFPQPSAPPSHIQGSVDGYSLGGKSPVYYNTIQKYSYSSDGNATDVADMDITRAQHVSTYSSTDAFQGGGYNGANIAAVTKFNFSSGANGTDFGDFPAYGRMGGATSSPTHGYVHGGNASTDTYGAPNQRHITKYPHSAGSMSTTLVSEFGISAVTRYNQTNASETHGYVSSIGPGDNKIEKYSYAVDGAATDVGDLLNTTDDGRGTHSGLMSDVSGGYGYVNSGYLDTTYDISRYPFASDGNAVDVCDRATDVWLGSVTASTTDGYMAGGLTPPPSAYLNVIQKFPFSSGSNATDVGDLVTTIAYNGGAAD